MQVRLTGPLLLAIAGLAVAAGCGGGSDEESTGSTGGSAQQTVTVNTTEFKLQPATIELDGPGTYDIEVVNDGTVDHALEIEGNDVEEETESIAPGESATLTVDLKDGTYEMYCPIDGHEGQGMKGSITVGSGGASSGTTTDDTDDDGGYG